MEATRALRGAAPPAAVAAVADAYDADARLCSDEGQAPCSEVAATTAARAAEVAGDAGGGGSESPRARKRQRVPDNGGGSSSAPAIDSADAAAWRSACLNNAALALAAGGETLAACARAREACAACPAAAQPAFNLAALLWKSGHKRAAAAHWLEWRGHALDEPAAHYDALRAAAAAARARASPPASHVPATVGGGVEPGQAAVMDGAAAGFWAADVRAGAGAERG